MSKQRKQKNYLNSSRVPKLGKIKIKHTLTNNYSNQTISSKEKYFNLLFSFGLTHLRHRKSTGLNSDRFKELIQNQLK